MRCPQGRNSNLCQGDLEADWNHTVTDFEELERVSIEGGNKAIYMVRQNGKPDSWSADVHVDGRLIIPTSGSKLEAFDEIEPFCWDVMYVTYITNSHEADMFCSHATNLEASSGPWRLGTRLVLHIEHYTKFFVRANETTFSEKHSFVSHRISHREKAPFTEE